MKERKHEQVWVFASVEQGVPEVAYSLATDRSLWRMENPSPNGEWVRLPDLPPDKEIPEWAAVGWDERAIEHRAESGY